ncbi:unnamed protein product [Darwinula stevensoni]|uniref:Geranylgeranyl transferase type-2 subunit alpha n=1 Tax=Darwinula stevensoni TaxID=69355 RepID=A0A7R9ACX8_9CRUS|nr:unnamed protein product [Darwinula stevensoni]CAG0900240.1 unnamed protein product [Darwinula stevensoni]
MIEMHGRVKVKTTAEKEAEKEKERKERLIQYTRLLDEVKDKRKNKECFQEVLDASKQVLLCNPDFGTMWNVRKEALLQMEVSQDQDAFQKQCLVELKLAADCLKCNPKSYGAWHHRIWIMERMPCPDWAFELDLTQKALGLDSRNFHCWDYRRYIVKKFGQDLHKELNYTSELILENFSNYSAWHYRSHLLPELCPDPNGTWLLSEEKRLEELELIQNAAFTDPEDQSAWLYHKSEKVLAALTSQLQSCQELIELEPESKWPLLTSVNLMRAIDPLQYKDEVNMVLQKLKSVDSQRDNFYTDLKSKFLIENHLQQVNWHAGSISFSEMSLSTIYCADSLLLFRVVDLSYNELKSVSPLAALQCCESLNLQHNCLTSCHGLECLPFLKELNIAENLIDDVNPLKECLNLKMLKIAGNPVALKVEELGDSLKAIVI